MKPALIALFLLGGIGLLAFRTPTNERPQFKLYPALAEYLKSAKKDLGAIPETRRAELDKIALFIQNKRITDKNANLLFVSGDNARRSLLAQVWAQVAADYLGVENVHAFSGGNIASTVAPTIQKTLEKIGFQVNPVTLSGQPAYELRFDEKQPALTLFSKVYTDQANPKNNFGLILTCDPTECPGPDGPTDRIAKSTVQGPAFKITLPYTPPRTAEGQANEAAVYNALNRQIATEMLYLFSNVH
ncbi:hypothetical protein [Spirosoma sp.]|uniref:hypothetical protein n=1 Tax=Spirosoma sp. TaxID=1899569 RepID=UPI00262D0A55|nr:hypothetical protein [Spirosoma sp.]MCX6213575.1 hypothetical protein [Spirosoma sp.]